MYTSSLIDTSLVVHDPPGTVVDVVLVVDDVLVVDVDVDVDVDVLVEVDVLVLVEVDVLVLVVEVDVVELVEPPSFTRKVPQYHVVRLPRTSVPVCSTR